MPSLVKPQDVLNQGELYWGEDHDAQGSEQKGDRLWAVMSRKSLNGNNTVVVVPLSRRLEKASKYPGFCILIPAQEMIPIVGQSASLDRVALCHQIRVMDKSKLREKWGSMTLSAAPSVQNGIAFVLNIL